MQTQPTAQRPARRASAAPSPAVAKALEALRAAITDEKINTHAAPPGAIVLPPPSGERTVDVAECGQHLRIEITSASGTRIWAQRSHIAQPNTPQEMQPPYWYGCEYRIDGQGRKWEHSLKKMVQDDFGTLVEVRA